MIDRHQTIGRPHSVKYGLTNFILLAILLLAVISVNGEELTNKYCPVTTSELAEEQFAVDYQGQTIYFCCSGCKKDFLSNPEAYLANLESSVPDSPQPESSHDYEEDSHEHNANATEATAEGQTTDADLSHDHATDHGQSSSLVRFVGKFHPMLTHFPIALILSALFFSLLTAVLKIQTMDYVSVYCIYLAAFTGIGTVILGLVAGSAASYPSFLTDFFSWHRFLGIATGIITIATAYAGRRLLQQSSRGAIWLYRIALIVNGILVSVTGHLGATLVFGPDHFNF